MYLRARVGISLPMDPNKSNPIHMGHARSLLIGELIANHYGCPYHVRLDNMPYLCDIDQTPMVLDLVNCLSFLRIHYDKMLPISDRAPTMAEMTRELGEKRAKKVKDLFNHPGFEPVEYKGVLTDDCFWHHKSLIIRGVEFKYPQIFWGTPPAHNALMANLPHVAAENALYDAMERSKHEINLPLMMNGDGAKISKSSDTPLHWRLLTGLSSDDARNFLVATALNPEDPIKIMEGLGKEPLNPDRLQEKAFVWDWEIWKELLKRQ